VRTGVQHTRGCFIQFLLIVDILASGSSQEFAEGEGCEQDVHPCIGAVTTTCARSTYLIRYSSLSIEVSYLFIRSVEQLKATST
jgi:hypothetical protein